MSIVARLDLDRSDRIVVARAATLRDHAMIPTDIMLDNLSTSGCHISVDYPLDLDAVISIGIPGIGNCFAQICRADQPNYGCIFLKPITQGEVLAATNAETVVQGNFPRRIVRPVDAPPQAEVDELPGLPMAGRAAVVVGLSAILWTGIIAGAWILS
jgi:hypothetical protein